MTIDAIAAYFTHALLVLPIVAVATVFVDMLPDARKAAPAHPHRFASPPITTEPDSEPFQPVWALESRVLEARHELASRRERRVASPAVLARAAVARARSNANDEVTV